MPTILQTSALPRLGSLPANRKLRDARHQPNKTVKAKTRKARSNYNAWYRRQYFLATAHSDLKLAASRNEDIVLAICVIAVTLAYGYSAIMAQLLIDILETIYTLTEVSSVSFTLLLAITIGVLSVTTAWVAAFISNALAIATMQGITRKHNRSIRLTLHQSLQQTTTTVTAWSLVLKRVAVPVTLAGIAGMVFVLTVPFHDNYWLLSLPIAASLIALGISLRRLVSATLMPLVMLFETKSTYSEAFTRSSELVRNKGRWFLAAVYSSLIVALAGAYGVAFLLSKAIKLPTGLTFTCAVLALLLYTNSLLVTFYTKRRRARA